METLRERFRREWLIGLVVTALAIVLGVQTARAAGPLGGIPAANFGAVTLAAATAAKVPAAPLDKRFSVAVQNQDAASIWCGWANTVTAANGWEVAPKGWANFDASYWTSQARMELWCYSAAGTVANGVRWTEIR